MSKNANVYQRSVNPVTAMLSCLVTTLLANLHRFIDAVRMFLRVQLARRRDGVVGRHLSDLFQVHFFNNKRGGNKKHTTDRTSKAFELPVSDEYATRE